MPLFGGAGKKPGKLAVEDIHRLTTSGRGKAETREALRRFGGKTNKSVVAVIVSHRNGKVLGSRWTVLGGAGKPDLKVKDLTGGDEEWRLKLDLTDLSVFKFNEGGAKANFSQWVEGGALVEKMKEKGGEELTDRTDIENKMEELSIEFVGRLVVVPMGGNDISCCFTVAPVSLEGMKKICQEKGCLENSPRIPVKEVKISTGKGEKNPKTVSFLPCEATWKEGPRGWVLFPLMEKAIEGGSSEAENWPSSEEIRRELFQRLRGVYLPGSTSEIWKFYDRENPAGVLTIIKIQN